MNINHFYPENTRDLESGLHYFIIVIDKIFIYIKKWRRPGVFVLLRPLALVLSTVVFEVVLARKNSALHAAMVGVHNDLFSG